MIPKKLKEEAEKMARCNHKNYEILEGGIKRCKDCGLTGDKIVKTNEEERFKKIINKFKIYPPKTIEDRIYNTLDDSISLSLISSCYVMLANIQKDKSAELWISGLSEYFKLTPAQRLKLGKFLLRGLHDHRKKA